jgi:nitrogen regulatory protein PII
MALELTQKSSDFVIYAFAFAIGFSTTMAEPSLMAIAKKAKEISDGKINDFVLRIFVAFGVAIGISLGAFRIIHGGEIVYYIISGYLVVIILTFIAPKYIIPIAYDSGGVTTSTVTVPLVAAIGLGLATNIPGRDPLIDGFGLIAFASLFPMITVMAYGVITDKMGVKGEHEKVCASVNELAQLADAYDLNLSTINIDATTKRYSKNIPFSAIHIIVPSDKKLEAIKAGLDAGARGATISEAYGFGLSDLEHFYNRLHKETPDTNIMFIVPTKKVQEILKNIIDKLDLVGEGAGIVYSYRLENLKGISLKSEDI